MRAKTIRPPKGYPVSFKAALVIFGMTLTIVLLLAVVSQGSKSQIILPDVELPWNKPADELVKTLNTIYLVGDQKTEWALCETGAEGLYRMCLKEQDKAGPFSFVFTQGKLTGYMAEFPEMEMGSLLYSADANYPKGIKGHTRGHVKTLSREFIVYERPYALGHLELYMVWDKDSLKVRVQTKYKYVGKKKKSGESTQPEVEDQKASSDDNTIANLSSFHYVSDSQQCSKTFERARLTAGSQVLFLKLLNGIESQPIVSFR